MPVFEPIRLLVIGFGNVGRQVARILTLERGLYSCLRDLEVAVVAITTREHGSLANPKGIDLARALRGIEIEGRFSTQNPEYWEFDSLEAIETCQYEILVELSTLNIEDSGEPALSHLFGALERGSHCVTANKGPIAFAYSDLAAFARERDCALLFESTVMDGAPVFSLQRAGLKGCEILEVEGILNSTTNFVLWRMEQGALLADAVRSAQMEGFAEADPRYDMEGWDSAAKISVLANVLMGADISPLDVEREGILSVQMEEARARAQMGKCLKLFCRAWREGNVVRAEVRVREFDRTSAFGLTEGKSTAIRISTDLLGPLMLSQQAPTLHDTAYGVLNDILTIRDDYLSR